MSVIKVPAPCARSLALYPNPKSVRANGPLVSCEITLPNLATPSVIPTLANPSELALTTS